MSNLEETNVHQLLQYSFIEETTTLQLLQAPIPVTTLKITTDSLLLQRLQSRASDCSKHAPVERPSGH